MLHLISSYTVPLLRLSFLVRNRSAVSFHVFPQVKLKNKSLTVKFALCFIQTVSVAMAFLFISFFLISFLLGKVHVWQLWPNWTQMSNRIKRWCDGTLWPTGQGSTSLWRQCFAENLSCPLLKTKGKQGRLWPYIRSDTDLAILTRPADGGSTGSVVQGPELHNWALSNH